MPLRTLRTILDPLSLEDAQSVQTEMARELRLGTQFRNVAGVSLAYGRNETIASVAVTVLSSTSWAIVHTQQAILDVTRPRVPDFENFREAPLMLEVLKRSAIVPDVIFVDGTGAAHPRRFGVASHVGLALEIPTIGVVDYWPSACLGHPLVVPGAKRGNHVGLHLALSRDLVGHQLQTQAHEPPIYVSPGHRVSVDEATSLTLRASPWSRHPLPLAAARAAAAKARDEAVLRVES